MRKILISIIVIVSIFSLAIVFLQNSFKPQDNGQVAGVTQERSGINKLTAQEFKQYIDYEGVTLIDIRTPQEYASGKIAGAINIDYYALNFVEQLDKLDRNGDYAIYCRTGNRSGEALKRMQDMGFMNVKELTGGISSYNL